MILFSCIKDRNKVIYQESPGGFPEQEEKKEAKILFTGNEAEVTGPKISLTRTRTQRNLLTVTNFAIKCGVCCIFMVTGG